MVCIFPPNNKRRDKMNTLNNSEVKKRVNILFHTINVGMAFLAWIIKIWEFIRYVYMSPVGGKVISTLLENIDSMLNNMDKESKEVVTTLQQEIRNSRQAFESAESAELKASKNHENKYYLTSNMSYMYALVKALMRHPDYTPTNHKNNIQLIKKETCNLEPDLVDQLVYKYLCVAAHAIVENTEEEILDKIPKNASIAEILHFHKEAYEKSRQAEIDFITEMEIPLPECTKLEIQDFKNRKRD